MPDKPFDLNLHTARLLMREPFFAALSRRIDKIRTDSVPTAGVRVNPDTAQFELFYNPKFMGALKDEHKLGVLMHEFYHIVSEHVTTRKPKAASVVSTTSRWISQSTDFPKCLESCPASLIPVPCSPRAASQ